MERQQGFRMGPMGRTLLIRGAPHVHSGASVSRIMLHVFLALLPAGGFAVVWFGWSAFATLATALVACVITERWLPRSPGGGSVDPSGSRGEVAIPPAEPTQTRVDRERRAWWGDGSAWVTGLIYGMTLPPGLPMWMTAIGGVVSVAVGKWLFGGLGSNPFNPALVGRAFLQAAFPAAMTTWMLPLEGGFSGLHPATLTLPFGQPPLATAMPDGITAATPLARYPFETLTPATTDLFWGTVGGSTGETSAILLLLGGLYLACRRMLDWRTPVAIFGTVAALSWWLHRWVPERCPDPVFMLGAGGLVLGAVFMATDMVTSPITHHGRIVFGVMIGVIVVVIRVWGGMPEGVMYAILLGNATVPLIDRFSQPVVYGTRRRGVSWGQSVKPGAVVVASPERMQSVAAGPRSSVSDEFSTRRSLANDDASEETAGHPVARMYAVVLGVGLVCSLGIVVTDYWTAPVIARKRSEFRQRAVLDVLPGATVAVPFVRRADGGFVPSSDAESVPRESLPQVFAGYDDQGRLVGMALEAEGQGYQDRIRLLFGYSPDAEAILAMRILESRETPGLGDRVETDPVFLANFGDLDVRLDESRSKLVHPIRLVSAGQRSERWEMDGITGATITSRAIAEMLGASAAVWLPALSARRDDFERVGQELIR